MPFTSTDKNRKDKLFRNAVLHLLTKTTAGMVEKQKNLDGLLVTGGLIMAMNAVENYEPLQKLWGKGDEEKALALIKICTLSIVSYINSVALDKFLTTIGTEGLLAEHILSLFGDNTEESIKFFKDMNSQYQYDHNPDNKLTLDENSLTYNTILASKIFEIFGKKVLGWSKIAFPVKSADGLSSAVLPGRALPDAKEVMKLNISFSHGVAALPEMNKRLR